MLASLPPSVTVVGDDRTRREAFAEHTRLTWTLSRKNFQVRYKRAVFGVMWAVLQPAFQALVLTLVFLKVFHAGAVDHFPLFVLSGLLPWTFFTQCLSAGTASVVENGSLVRKIALPLQVFPFAAIGGNAIAFAAALPILLVSGLVVGTIGWQLLLLPLALVLQLLAVAGLATLTSSLYPAFRDVRYLVESSVLVGLYLTPVLYPPERLPGLAQQILRFNPMTGVLALYRAAFLSREVDWLSVGASALVGVLLLAIGLAVFRRRSDEFADLV